MDIVLYVLAGLSVTWAAYMAYIWVAGKSAEGRPLEDLWESLPQVQAFAGQKGLLYCYSPNCGPCRSMSPIIDSLTAEGHPVAKLNIAEDPALARQLGVRAAPTLLLIEDQAIAQVVIGGSTRKRILSLLDKA